MDIFDIIVITFMIGAFGLFLWDKYDLCRVKAEIEKELKELDKKDENI